MLSRPRRRGGFCRSRTATRARRTKTRRRGATGPPSPTPVALLLLPLPRRRRLPPPPLPWSAWLWGPRRCSRSCRPRSRARSWSSERPGSSRKEEGSSILLLLFLLRFLLLLFLRGASLSPRSTPRPSRPPGPTARASTPASRARSSWRWPSRPFLGRCRGSRTEATRPRVGGEQKRAAAALLPPRSPPRSPGCLRPGPSGRCGRPAPGRGCSEPQPRPPATPWTSSRRLPPRPSSSAPLPPLLATPVPLRRRRRCLRLRPASPWQGAPSRPRPAASSSARAAAGAAMRLLLTPLPAPHSSGRPPRPSGSPFPSRAPSGCARFTRRRPGRSS